MILMFSNNRGTPRKGEYLFCFTTPKELHKFNEWGDKTYGDLIKNKGFGTEVVCIWQAPLKDDKRYCLVGFRGIDIDFAEHIQNHAGAFFILGPNLPPYQYILNLQDIVKNNRNPQIENLIEGEILENKQKIASFPQGVNITDFLVKQLTLSDCIILQGPPGTGKTTQIAALCKYLCEQGASVLVTALTNRALMEVAAKQELEQLLNEEKIHKTKLSTDEANENPLIQKAIHATPILGHIMLSTFYITSGEARLVFDNPPFDYVIMDEASQALLGMFAAVRLLGKKCIFVGDYNQLSPVISINNDRITKHNYHFYVDGLVSISSLGNIPSYRLTSTYRLPQRAANFTGLFYDGTLQSKENSKISLSYPDISNPIGKIFNSAGGPTLLKTGLPLGDKKPTMALMLAIYITSFLLCQKERLHISILSAYVETTKALQKFAYQTIGAHSNLLIDTVSRIQGLTTDVVIYVIPNTVNVFTLDRRLFNVATSRARRHTIIVADNDICNNLKYVDKDVAKYLILLDKSSFYIPLQTPVAGQIQDEQINKNTQETTEFTPELEIIQEEQIERNTENIETQKSKTTKQADTQSSDLFQTETPKIEVKVVGKIDLSKFEKKIKNTEDNTYIIDTNVFVDCPDIINKLGSKCEIILSAKVVDELDKLKITLDEKGKKSVQNALKNINKAMDCPNIQFEIADMRILPKDFDHRSPDNMILSVALRYKNSKSILLTSDNGLQIKAKGLGIQTQSLRSILNS